MKFICITNRLLCKNDFFEQIKFVCKKNLYALILREKDLDDKTYEEFAVKCNRICKETNVLFFINTKINIAQKLKINNIQVSFKDFLNNRDILSSFDNIVVSVHSIDEASEVERCTDAWMHGCIETEKKELIKKNIFLIAGHIFETDCKKGLKPKGTDFLKELCNNVKLPVFAIGGINQNTIKQLKGINIEGVCLMSTLMKKSIPTTYNL